MSATSFRCLQVSLGEDKKAVRRITQANVDSLPAGDVLVRVAYSSLNYKDALSASGHPGVTRKFPHVPGIDAAGTVVESSDARFPVGTEVLVNGFDLGQNTWGGWGELIRVPAGWLVRVPESLSLREAAIYGVAGFTAALSLEALLHAGLNRESGEILVTGATGGVGSVAVALLAKVGIRVAAATGKPEAADYLRRLGATSIVDRAELAAASSKPLLAARWAGAVDTVGGVTLTNVIKSIAPHGYVAASGLVGGTDLPLTVYPFILRGVILAGIDSAEYPIERRAAIWSHLAGDWKPNCLNEMVYAEVDIAELESHIVAIAAGKIRGRVLVKHAAG